MAKKSIYAQLDARAVPPHKLKSSPRHWNPGLLRYRGKLWMGYRYHRKETSDSRCGLAITELDSVTFEPMGQSSRLAFQSDDHHHEDCRLFLFRGEPHISYTEMRGYRPGIDYTCTMRYARLKLTGNRWSVVEEFYPVFGSNGGFSKEKNWIFFDHEGELMCIYAGAPDHLVLHIDGSRVVKEYRTAGATWHWGIFRGGTPPVNLGDGRMLAIFHSSLPTEIPPHYVRYYGAAYTFEAKPPFPVLEISELPIMAGSEQDGHQVDPRYVEGWKPFVVFPCGLVPDGDGFLCSLGVNDWQCAIARLQLKDLMLGTPDGNLKVPRYFRVPNGTMPVKYMDINQKPEFLHWTVVRRRGVVSAGEGIMQVSKSRDVAEIMDHPNVEEIDAAEYQRMMRMVAMR